MVTTSIEGLEVADVLNRLLEETIGLEFTVNGQFVSEVEISDLEITGVGLLFGLRSVNQTAK